MTPGAGGRKGADRRLTFTQTPYTEAFSGKLSGDTDISRADLYNTAMQVLSVVLGMYTTSAGPLYRADPALQVLLGNILVSLDHSETQEDTAPDGPEEGQRIDDAGTH